MKAVIFPLMFSAVLLTVSCGGGSLFDSGANSSPIPPTGSPPNAPTSETTIIPPVPVAGSFLTGILNLPDGSASQQTNVVIEETDYKAKTDENGHFKVPVSQIPQKDPVLKITVNSKDLLAQVNIPADVLPLIAEGKNAGPEVRELKRRVAILLPASISNATHHERIQSTTFSLPTQTANPALPVQLWGEPKMETSPDKAQILWGANQKLGGEFTLIAGRSAAEVSGWDGENSKLPAHSLQFNNFAQCNDSALSSPKTGPLSASSASKCALNLSLPPFEPGVAYFFKMSIQAPDLILVSTVFAPPPATSSSISVNSSRTFSVPGQFSLTVPAGAASMTVKVWGAGGDGLGEPNATCSPGAKSGGGGGFVQGTISVVVGAAIKVNVGDGQLAGPAGLAGFGAGTGGQSSSVIYANELIAMAGGGGGAGQSASGGGGGGDGPGRAGAHASPALAGGGAGGTRTTGCQSLIWSTNDKNGCAAGGSASLAGNRGGGGGAGFFGGLGGSGSGFLVCTGSGGGGGSGYLHPNATQRASVTGADGSASGAAAVNQADPHYAPGTGGSGQPGSVTVIFN